MVMLNARKIGAILQFMILKHDVYVMVHFGRQAASMTPYDTGQVFGESAVLGGMVVGLIALGSSI